MIWSICYLGGWFFAHAFGLLAAYWPGEKQDASVSLLLGGARGSITAKAIRLLGKFLSPCQVELIKKTTSTRGGRNVGDFGRMCKLFVKEADQTLSIMKRK